MFFVKIKLTISWRKHAFYTDVNIIMEKHIIFLTIRKAIGAVIDSLLRPDCIDEIAEIFSLNARSDIWNGYLKKRSPLIFAGYCRYHRFARIWILEIAQELKQLLFLLSPLHIFCGSICVVVASNRKFDLVRNLRFIEIHDWGPQYYIKLPPNFFIDIFHSPLTQFDMQPFDLFYNTI